MQKVITEEAAYDIWLDHYDDIMPFKDDHYPDFIDYLESAGVTVVVELD